MKSSDVTGLCGKTRLFCLKLKEKKTISTETETSGSEKGSMWDSQTETMEILSTVKPPYNTHTFCNVGRVVSGAFMGVLIVADTADRQQLSRTSHVACNLSLTSKRNNHQMTDSAFYVLCRGAEKLMLPGFKRWTHTILLTPIII